MAGTGAPEIAVDAPRQEPPPNSLLQAAADNGRLIEASPGDFAASPESGSYGKTPSGGQAAGRPYIDQNSNGHSVERWLAGVTYSPESIEEPVLLDSCTGFTADDNVNSRTAPRYHHPWFIEIVDQCSDFGWQAADYRGRALRRLLASETIALEAEFERGVLYPQDLHLNDGVRVFADGGTTNTSATVTSASFNRNMIGWTISGTGIPAATVIQSVVLGVSATLSAAATATGNPISFTVTNPNFVVLNGGVAVTCAQGIALLNEAIASSTVGQGMIHATSYVVERWAQTQSLRIPDQPHLLSITGNPIVAGNGYTGKGGGGGAAGYDTTGGTAQSQAPIGAGTVQWAYATGMIQIIRAAEPTIYPIASSDEEFYRMALDRNAGTVTARASRPYVVEFAGQCHAAVKIAVTT